MAQSTIEFPEKLKAAGVPLTQTDKAEIIDLINEAILHHGTQQAFADRCGVSVKFINAKHVAGDHSPSKKTFQVWKGVRKLHYQNMQYTSNR